MSALPDILKIPEGREKRSLPPRDLPVSDLIKFQLPPQRKDGGKTAASYVPFRGNMARQSLSFDAIGEHRRGDYGLCARDLAQVVLRGFKRPNRGFIGKQGLRCAAATPLRESLPPLICARFKSPFLSGVSPPLVEPGAYEKQLVHTFYTATRCESIWVLTKLPELVISSSSRSLARY
ncbi:hypothetical protein DFH09DRAFT_1094509 [Mycena vulgaris]|nr:hypothetical protein DFH09DRAFT_1094509 [Mycena vulgaris]